MAEPVSGGVASDRSLMQDALGAQWHELPAALQAHYQAGANTDFGALDIEYPRSLQWPFDVLHFVVGALVNRRGKAVPTTVAKHRDGPLQHWRRTLRFADGRVVRFDSHWEYAGGNELVEYVNRHLGLCMAVRVENGALHYAGRYYALRLGRVVLRLPEWLVLGHTTIVERAVDAAQFEMDFRLHHPLFGQIYRYRGRFVTRRSPQDPQS